MELKLTKTQRTAKVRLYKWLDENKATANIESLSLQRMGEISKSSQLETWILNQEFALWWFNRDSLSDKISSYKEIAVNRLCEILESNIEGGRDARITSKDVMNAAKTILELGDAFPKSKKEIVFADKKVNSMNDAQVEKELAAVKKRLAVAND